MSEVSQEEMDAVDDLLTGLDPSRGWIAAWAECRVCGWQHISVHATDTDDEALECPKCHQLTAEAFMSCPIEFGEQPTAEVEIRWEKE